MYRYATLALGFAAALLVSGCANPADDKPEAQVSEKTEAPAGRLAVGDVYVIGDGSTLSFTGSKVTGSHDGGFHTFGGEVVVVGNDVTRSRVTIDIDATSLWADNEKLTGHLQSPDFFDVASHPKASFASTRIDPNPSGEGFLVTGNLDLHGVTKSITFPAMITIAGGMVAAEAEFVIQRFDFGIEYAGKADDLIRDEVVIKLDLNAQPKAG
jgi:polyisoprenoid-binding protein YceI